MIHKEKKSIWNRHIHSDWSIWITIIIKEGYIILSFHSFIFNPNYY